MSQKNHDKCQISKILPRGVYLGGIAGGHFDNCLVGCDSAAGPTAGQAAGQEPALRLEYEPAGQGLIQIRGR